MKINLNFNKMSQDEYYKTLLTIIKDLCSKRASTDVDDDPSTSAILNRSEVAEESFDKAPTLNDKKKKRKKETQKEDGQNKIFKSDQGPLSGKSAQFDEGVSQSEMDVNDVPSISEILNRFKVAEENFDKAATLDDKKLQTQKEDGRNKNVKSDQSPLSDKSAQFDEGVSQSEMDVDVPSTLEILIRFKVTEENFDQAATLDDEMLQTQKEDGRDKNVKSDQSPLSNKSAQCDERMSWPESLPSGSDESEASSYEPPEKHQESIDIFPECDITTIMMYIATGFVKRSNPYFRPCLNRFYKKIINRPKVAEDNFDKAATLDDEMLQTQKEDGRDKIETFDEGMSRSDLAASGSDKSQDVTEASNEVSPDRQQEWMDLFTDSDYSIEIPRLYKPCLKLFYAGQYEEAQTMCEVKLEGLLKETRTKENDLKITMFVEILAIIYRKTNRYDDAIMLLSKALEMHKVIHGSNHPVVVITLNNLGICHAMVERYLEGQNLCRSTIWILQDFDGDNWWSMARLLHSLGAMFQITEDHFDASEHYEQALVHYKHTPNSDQDKKKVVQNLTTCYLKMGKVQQSEALQKRC